MYQFGRSAFCVSSGLRSGLFAHGARTDASNRDCRIFDHGL
jgi:hypothetical protein